MINPGEVYLCILMFFKKVIAIVTAIHVTMEVRALILEMHLLVSVCLAGMDICVKDVST